LLPQVDVKSCMRIQHFCVAMNGRSLGRNSRKDKNSGDGEAGSSRRVPRSEYAPDGDEDPAVRRTEQREPKFERQESITRDRPEIVPHSDADEYSEESGSVLSTISKGQRNSELEGRDIDELPSIWPGGRRGEDEYESSEDEQEEEDEQEISSDATMVEAEYSIESKSNDGANEPNEVDESGSDEYESQETKIEAKESHEIDDDSEQAQPKSQKTTGHDSGKSKKSVHHVVGIVDPNTGEVNISLGDEGRARSLRQLEEEVNRQKGTPEGRRLEQVYKQMREEKPNPPNSIIKAINIDVIGTPRYPTTIIMNIGSFTFSVINTEKGKLKFVNKNPEDLDKIQKFINDLDKFKISGVDNRDKLMEQIQECVARAKAAQQPSFAAAELKKTPGGRKARRSPCIPG